MASSPRNAEKAQNAQKIPNAVEVPKDQNVAEQVASPVASLSSHVDPWPHYIMSGACAAGAGYAYNTLKNPRVAAMAGGFSLLYFTAGRYVVGGSPKFGYDLGTATSLGLAAVAMPNMWATTPAFATTFASLGGVSLVANAIKSYEQRTGKPHELIEK